ncbi:putative phosphoglycerate mutase [Oxalobacteraceae bacterium GrIS 2.11]
MIELLLIRHGETDWNLERRLQGHVDIPLNATGHQQAKAVAGALASEHLDLVVSSDLQRAMQTAEAIAAHKNLDCQIDREWRERSFGGFEGELIGSLEQRFPVEYAAWRNHDIDSLFPLNPGTGDHGETVRQFQARIESALLNLTRYDAQKIVVVAHGGVLECVHRIAQHLPLNAPRTVSLLNASINRFALSVVDDQMVLNLVQWGDVRHLNGALDEVAQ